MEISTSHHKNLESFAFSVKLETSRTMVKRMIDAKEVSPTKKQSSTADKENSLLANLMQHHMRGIDAVSFKKSSVDLDFMIRTKKWVEAWKMLLEKGLIEPCDPGGAITTADHKLTEKGKAYASTPEYEEFVKDKTFVAATNQDHQQRIKKRLVNEKTGQRGVQIFDLLLEHGSLQRKELCEILGVKSGTHSFSYALKELKDKGFVEGKGSEKLRLTDKAFLSPADRPNTQPDKAKIDKLISMTKIAREKKGKNKNKDKKDKPKPDIQLDSEQKEVVSSGERSSESVASSAKESRHEVVQEA